MNKLTVKDLVLVGVLNAIILILYMGIGGVFSVIGSWGTLLYSIPSSLIVGIVFTLLIVKVPRRGVFAISGIIQAIIFFVMGGFWTMPAALIVAGIIGGVIIGSKVTPSKLKLSYSMWSGIFTFGVISPIRIFTDQYIATCQKNHIPAEYIDSLVNAASTQNLIIIIIASIIAGYLGVVLGTKILKKHFIKAGLVSDVNR